MNEKLNQARDKATQTANWLKKQIMENWRLILVAAIVIVISLNSFQGEKGTKENNQSTPSPSAQETQNNAKNSENPANTGNTTNTAKAQEKIPENVSASANIDQTGISQTIQKGEGMTHLARRAIKGYLARNNRTLTSEQKIYAEDYVRKNTPAQKMKTGNTINFNEEIIKKAIDKSGILTEKQIKNLGKFVPLVKNL